MTRGACCAASVRLLLQEGQHTCTASTLRKPSGHSMIRGNNTGGLGGG
jgi:hypothetical protein